MVQAEVTFTVELTDDEAKAIEYARDGLSDMEIATRMKVSPIRLKANFDGLHLANTLNLVAATREGYVSWVFHEWARRTMTG